MNLLIHFLIGFMIGASMVWLVMAILRMQSRSYYAATEKHVRARNDLV